MDGKSCSVAAQITLGLMVQNHASLYCKLLVFYWLASSVFVFFR